MNKGIIILGIIGIIIIATTLILVSTFSDDENVDIATLTGTPADNYPEIDREKHCGIGEAKSNKYVKEYKIPTICSQPQAIMIGPDDKVWFVQSNTGEVANFDPSTETFTKYDNPQWPKEPSMISGIDYASDNSIWFTDDKHDSVWKFNLDNEQYYEFSFPSDGSSIPQKLKIIGSQMIVNDLTGNKIAVYDLTAADQNMSPFIIPSNNPNAVTSSFILDDDKNLWYPTWEPNATGVIIKINQTSLENAIQNFPNSTLNIDFFPLPIGLSINGIDFDNEQNLWLADSSTSSFYKFEPVPGNRNYTKYVTSDPSIHSYGNFSGNIENPSSRPNWIKSDSIGNMIFNEPQANRIGVMNPETETLIEYEIPSKNPYWGDCNEDENCGISQILEFAITEEKIWFSEWAENNIGYVDTSIPMPINLEFDSQNVYLSQGDTTSIEFIVTSEYENKIPINPIISNPNFESGIDVQLGPVSDENFVNLENSAEITVTMSASENALLGEYKILVGASLQDVSVSNFITVIIE